jgi:hypothetical protein
MSCVMATLRIMAEWVCSSRSRASTAKLPTTYGGAMAAISRKSMPRFANSMARQI